MKKFFIHTFQPGIAVLILTLLNLIPCADLSAQGYQTEQYLFPSQVGNNVIIRENFTGVPLISYRSTKKANFVYGDIYTNNTKKFEINDSMDMTGSCISYKINDMRVIGNMCYFCGVRWDLHEDPESGAYVTDSTGVLGRFPLDPLGFGQSVKFHLKLIRETKSLDRMATYAQDRDTVIAMIGIVDEPASQSCLAVARVDNSNQWKYIVKYTNNNPSEEVFTDIAITNLTTYIAAHYRSNTDKYYIHIRMNDNASLSGGSYSRFDTMNSYLLASYSLSDTLYELIRPDYSAVQLCSTPWDVVCVAFPCLKRSPTLTYPTAVCNIRTVGKVMANMQIVKYAHSNPHTLVDMDYIYQTTGGALGSMIALLHNTSGSYKTVVEYPSGTIYYNTWAPVHRLVDNQMQSISVYNGDDIRLGGIWSSSSQNLTYLQEEQPTLNEKNQCIDVSQTEILPVEGALQPTALERTLHFKTTYELDFEWGKKSTPTIAVDVENVCIQRSEE
ncbi:MAG: hypothetical protein IKG81_10810 [Bacteroidales bacterium]|nr:hypothetical protein [Bacteroidales bacterium]